MVYFSEKLKSLIALPAVRGVDLDAPDAIRIHREIIQSKSFLRRLYVDFYSFFLQEAKTVSSLSGKMLEIGSGGGFLDEVLPDVITSDVCASPLASRIVDAEHLPFGNGELKALFLLNVLHHLPDPRAFFREASRSLTPRGRLVMVEPFNAFFGRFIYQHFHTEPFDPKVATWKQTGEGRMSRSNQAIPWIIFSRDRRLFEQEFPTLKVLQVIPHTPFRYLLSGGVSIRTLVPDFTYPAFRMLDQVFSHFAGIFPMFQTIVVERREGGP